MVVHSSQEKEIIELLNDLAGSPLLVEEAFDRLTEQQTKPPTLSQLVDYILLHRDQWHREHPTQDKPIHHRVAPSVGNPASVGL